MRDRKEGSFVSALIWGMALSVIVGWFPILGPLATGVAVGRKARHPLTALVAALLPALVWAGGLWFLSGREIKIGGQLLMLGPLSILGIVQASSLLAGALAGAGGNGSKIAGVAVLVAGLAYFLPKASELAKIVSNVMSATQIKYEPDKNKTCPENLKQLYTAVQLYADSWDGLLPPSDRWMTAIKPIVTKNEWLHCPEVSKGQGPKFGYAMNPELGGKRLDKIENRPNIPLFYDSKDLQIDAHGTLDTLPKPGRHTGRNNVLFADGTVK